MICQFKKFFKITVIALKQCLALLTSGGISVIVLQVLNKLYFCHKFASNGPRSILAAHVPLDGSF